MQYGVDTISAAIEAYQAPEASYRSVALHISGRTLPPELTLSGFFGGVEALPIGPTHIFRWVARFAAGAGQWFSPMAAQAQELLTHALSLPTAPKVVEKKIRSAEKGKELTDTWILLWVLRFLLDLLGLPTGQWPYVLIYASKTPSLLDHTGWFIIQPRAPP